MCRYDDGVLLSIDQMSTGNFDQVKVVLSCDQVGVFEVEIKYSGVTASAAKVLYNDLVRSLAFLSFLLPAAVAARSLTLERAVRGLHQLDAQYNGRVQMSIEIAEVNVNLFLYLIHKKWVVLFLCACLMRHANRLTRPDPNFGLQILCLDFNGFGCTVAPSNTLLTYTSLYTQTHTFPYIAHAYAYAHAGQWSVPTSVCSRSAAASFSLSFVISVR